MRPVPWRPILGRNSAACWRPAEELLMPEKDPSYLGPGAIARILSPANWARLPTTLSV
jgi:hypothetical protein